jgi:hypothetical protein
LTRAKSIRVDLHSCPALLSLRAFCVDCLAPVCMPCSCCVARTSSQLDHAEGLSQSSLSACELVTIRQLFTATATAIKCTTVTLERHSRHSLTPQPLPCDTLVTPRPSQNGTRPTRARHIQCGGPRLPLLIFNLGFDILNSMVNPHPPSFAKRQIA